MEINRMDINKARPNYWSVKHDMSRTNLYRRWVDMRGRCFNPANCNYKNYGARGISVCDEWSDFKVFADWALSHGYSRELSLDRINNDGDYCPENCRWTTKSVQNMSMRHKNTSGYVGICKRSNGKGWYGRLKVDGKCFYTGDSMNIHEAARMRNDYIDEHNLSNVKNVIKE